MSERPTPETDDLLNTIRKLECELAEAVKARDHNRTSVKRLTEERDEARENAKHWCDMHILAVKDFNEAREQIAKANSEREQLWIIMHDAYQPLISAGNYELSERIRYLLERGPQAYLKKFSEEKAADDDLTEHENDTQAELAAWELLKQTRELARELRDALTSMEEYYRQHIIRGSLFLQVHAALTKAKEVLP